MYDWASKVKSGRPRACGRVGLLVSHGLTCRTWWNSENMCYWAFVSGVSPVSPNLE